MTYQKAPRGRAILATGAVIGTACASVLFAAPANAATTIPAPAVAATTCNGLPVTITGTDGPDPNLVGTAGNDVIAAGAGNDVVSGLDGRDTVCLGTGNDRFDGGPGFDTFVAEAVPDGSDTIIGDSLALDTATYRARTTPVNVSLDGIANDGAAGERDNIGNSHVVGGSAADTLTDPSVSLRPLLRGGPGNDTLSGNFLNGEAGNDALTHTSLASAIMFGDDGNDKLTDKSSARNGFISGGSGADTILGGNGGDNLNGGDGDDRIIGGSDDDFLRGDAGNDTLVGVFGNDFLGGDDGDDTLVATSEQDGSDNFSGGAGNDTADYSGRNNLASGNVLSLSLDGVRNDGEPGEGDLLDVENVKGGTGHNVITGNTDANTLQGGQNFDEINGRDFIFGNDVIIGGGLGRDSCTFDPGDRVSANCL